MPGAEGVWDPDRYHRFQPERQQPFFDLVALVRPRPSLRVLDLGCGTGELTLELHRRLEAHATLGVDNSPAMLERARALEEAGLRFEDGDLAAPRSDGPYDVVFSNAALHWASDHPALLARLTNLLAPEGQLAVQVPANHDHIAHRTVLEVAGEEPFRKQLGAATVPGSAANVLPADAYASLLDRLGYRQQHVRLQVYGHRLDAREDVPTWMEGSTLTPYRQRLGDLYPAFLDRYRSVLVARLEDRRPYFYPFKRILFWGTR